MTSLIKNSLDSLSHASLVAGVACGAMVGYTLSASGDLLNNTLIAASCGISRAAQGIIFDNPLNDRILIKVAEQSAKYDEQKALELEALSTSGKISAVLYKANLGFGLGIALGTGGGAASLLSGILSGALVHAVGFFSEVLPVVALVKPRVMNFDENGHLIT